MMRHWAKTLMVTLLAGVFATPAAMSQQGEDRVYRDDEERYDESYDSGYDTGDRGRTDRYLGVEIWPNHHDGEYYEGDNITLNFRTNRDAFVAIYSIDSRGRVNLLFPAGPNADNFVQGGATHQLPSGYDDYDLVVSGPAGIENVQILASREPFQIPDWYPVSGIFVDDNDDRMEFMDWLNDRYFVRYGGQRFAYDRTAIYINEWEEYYFRPVYYPTYHPWTLAGNMYIDYPWGSSVYINGIYWGCTPLYLPRVYVGWHTITIYDHWGYCWESDIHISRYNTIVLDVDVIHTSPRVQSKYREVRVAGYRDPVKHGYPDYAQKRLAIETSAKIRTREVTVTKASGERVTEKVTVAPKKHVRGSSALVKTDRGIESSAISPRQSDRETVSTSNKGRGSVDVSRGGYEQSPTYGSGKSRTQDRQGIEVGRSEKSSRGSSGDSNSGSGYYQKKSGDRKPGYQSGQNSRPSFRSGDKSKSSGKSTGPAVRQAPKQDNSGSGAKVQGKSSGSAPSSAPKAGSPSSSGGSKNSGSSGKSSGGGKADGKGKNR